MRLSLALLLMVRFTLVKKCTAILVMMLWWSCCNHTMDQEERLLPTIILRHKLALSLLQQNLTLLGTMRTHRREIPEELQNKKRPVTSSLFAFDHENKVMLVSYIPKRNKNVVMLSSSHSGNVVFSEMANKPELIHDFNFGKKGVDQLDENVEEFTCRRKTVRWPLLVFYNMLDVAAFNGYLLMKNDGYQSSRKLYLKCLRMQLAKASTVQRLQRNIRLPATIKEAAALLGFQQPRRTLVSYTFYMSFE